MSGNENWVYYVFIFRERGGQPQSFGALHARQVDEGRRGAEIGGHGFQKLSAQACHLRRRHFGVESQVPKEEIGPCPR